MIRNINLLKYLKDTIIRWASWFDNVDSKVLSTYLQYETRAKKDERVKYAMKYSVLKPNLDDMHGTQMNVLLDIQN